MPSATHKKRSFPPAPRGVRKGPALVNFVRPNNFPWKHLPTDDVTAEAMGLSVEEVTEIWRAIDETLNENPQMFQISFVAGSDNGKQRFCDNLSARFLHLLDNATLFSLMQALETKRQRIGYFLWKFALKRRASIGANRRGIYGPKLSRKTAKHGDDQAPNANESFETSPDSSAGNITTSDNSGDAVLDTGN